MRKNYFSLTGFNLRLTLSNAVQSLDSKFLNRGLIAVTTGLPHHSKAPRVILVQKQFAVGTATDLMHLPKNYKMGNVVFGDYERDEVECGLTRKEIRDGQKCPRAYLEVPPLDITPHPEFSRFGVGNSLALIKLLRPVKSNYMVPICLPSISERTRKKVNKYVYLVDYISSVPRDFDFERMGKKTVKLYTHRECKRHRMKSKLSSEGVTHVLCSSGCGVRPGAPIITHTMEGRFELMGLAAGGAPCSHRSMRRRLNDEPPLYIDVFPYASWIINVISAHKIPKAYPETFQLTDGGSRIGIKKGLRSRSYSQMSDWKGRTFATGNLCFASRKAQRKASFFYAEKFEMIAGSAAQVHIVLNVYTGYECRIMCCRLTLPSRDLNPSVEGVGGFNVTIIFSSEWFPYGFTFSMGLSGMNVTYSD
ncbi:unnamed protein product [Arctia plantaginis]|uniref:Peptidase S1 domain-containing protein n=1 Tax=Arctia plantaginis TaxID=874455 RepID=A0A8S0ZZB7_ARCPL|nr:unnamed protein product [Arctia plantaginis]